MCDYFFVLNSVMHLDNPNTLKILIEQNRGVISPIMVKPGQVWSNVWGAIGADGYYVRSVDYLNIIGGLTK